MKKNTLFTVVVLSLAASITACGPFSKENRLVNKLQGKWKVTNAVLPLDGKDSTLDASNNTIEVVFDECKNPGEDTWCSSSLTVKKGEVAYDNFYLPLSYVVKGNDQMTMLVNGDSVFFKVDDYKKGKLKLTGSDNTFSGTSAYTMEAELIKE